MSVKKQKLTENLIQHSWPVDEFTRQYQTCLLLLAHGIPGLPYDLVYLIVKEYVYVKPLRIAVGCYNTYVDNVHTGEGYQMVTHQIYNFQRPSPGTWFERWTHEEIVAWFEKHKFRVPEHFLQIEKKTF